MKGDTGMVVLREDANLSTKMGQLHPMGWPNEK